MEVFSAFNNAKYQGKFISFDEEGASVNFRLQVITWLGEK